MPEGGGWPQRAPCRPLSVPPRGRGRKRSQGRGRVVALQKLCFGGMYSALCSTAVKPALAEQTPSPLAWCPLSLTVGHPCIHCTSETLNHFHNIPRNSFTLPLIPWASITQRGWAAQRYSLAPWGAWVVWPQRSLSVLGTGSFSWAGSKDLLQIQPDEAGS